MYNYSCAKCSESTPDGDPGGYPCYVCASASDRGQRGAEYPNRVTNHALTIRVRTRRTIKRILALLILASGMSVSGQPGIWPIQNTGGRQWVSSEYGVRRNPMGGAEGGFHAGIDIACRVGTPIVAVTDGIITVCATRDPVFGKYLVLHSTNGFDSLYGHLSEQWYSRGQVVKQGWVIGLSGNTGLSTGPHLHFQVMQNPLRYFEELEPWIGRH